MTAVACSVCQKHSGRLGEPSLPCLRIAVALATSACRQDMYNQPKYKPLARERIFRDDASARPLPPHTIPRGHLDEDTRFLHRQERRRHARRQRSRCRSRSDLLKRGQERFNIYCSVCHGAEGDGNGMIVQRGFPPPPSYHIDRLRHAPPGYSVQRHHQRLRHHVFLRLARGTAPTAGPSSPTSARCNSAATAAWTTCPPTNAPNWRQRKP